MGGNFLLKLNIDPRPIANKYHEGKVKRTLKKKKYRLRGRSSETAKAHRG
eukprot:TRINITY_DN102_c0_g2_i2.p3 TRINITY_DN102_c0_g2~~TRINITY_DN102_c0_g2_i2.p3  ORF type:complete len:50 (-),score=23.14 TRINITY_DN102_c0_g2_i2:2-151(-)